MLWNEPRYVTILPNIQGHNSQLLNASTIALVRSTTLFLLVVRPVRTSRDVPVRLRDYSPL